MFTTHGHWFAPSIPGEPRQEQVQASCPGIAACPQCVNETIRNSQDFPGGMLGVLNAQAPPVVPLSSAPQPGVMEVPVDELADWYQRYLELKDAQSKISDMVDEARSTFLDALARRHAELPDKVNMTIKGKPVLQRQVVIQNRVDTTRLRREQPQLAEQYSKLVRQERLNIL
jgi:hypothetical protein